MTAQIINIFDYTPRHRKVPDIPATIILLPKVQIDHLISPMTGARVRFELEMLRRIKAEALD